MRRIVAVILAAGKGLRMGSDTPKQYLDINGHPVLYHTLRAFDNSRVTDIIIVVPASDIQYVRTEFTSHLCMNKSIVCISGGAERFDSSYAGIQAAMQTLKGDDDLILIHDAVRCLVTPREINRLIDDLDSYDACCLGVPVKDTIRVVDEHEDATSTPDRFSLRIIQTPQGFKPGLLCRAYESFRDDPEAGSLHITDDAMLVERYTNEKIHITQGSYENIKITTPEDLLTAAAILKNRA